jgi:hypothetical protein
MPRIEDNDKLGQFMTAFQRSEDYTRTYFDRAKTHYKHYRLYRDKDRSPYANSIFCPDTFNFVEDATAKLISVLLSRSPVYSVIPRKGGSLDVAAQLSVVLQYCVETSDFDFFIEFVDFIKNGSIFGTSFMSVLPDFKFTEQGLVYSGPRFDYNDFWDIYPDPMARRLGRNCRYIIKRSKVYIEELLDMETKKIYKNVQQLQGLNAGNIDDERKQLLMEIGVEQYIDTNQDVHEILEMYSYGHIITVADRQVILRDTRTDEFRPYPYDIPLAGYRYITVPGEFYGMGVPEIIRELQADKNTIRSQRRENVDLILNKIIMKRSQADIDIDTLKFFPGAIWEVEDIQRDIKEMDLRDVTGSSYQEEERLDMDMERATGQYRYSQGQAPQREETATGIMRLQAAAQTRPDMNIKLTEFSAMRQIASMVILQIRQFMPQAEYERIVGESDAGFYQLPIQDIQRFYDFNPVGSSVTQVKEMRTKQIMEATKMAMGIPPQVQQMGGFQINYRKLFEMAYREGLDIKNWQEIIMDAPPPPPPMGPGGGPMSGGGPPLPPDEILRQALAESAPNQQLAEMAKTAPIEELKSMLQQGGHPGMGGPKPNQ